MRGVIWFKVLFSEFFDQALSELFVKRSGEWLFVVSGNNPYRYRRKNFAKFFSSESFRFVPILISGFNSYSCSFALFFDGFLFTTPNDFPKFPDVKRVVERS
jgi:hypothetical protein